MLRRIGVLASVAVTAAMFVGVTSAQADPSGGVSCLFRGMSVQVSSPIGPPPADIGLSYSFAFSGPGDCAGVVGGQVLIPEGDADGNVGIASSGDYNNVVCSTGWMWDSSTSANPSTTITPNADLTARIADFDYEIFFVAGHGHMRIGGGPWTAPGAGPGMLGGDWVGDGHVQFVPKNRTLPDSVGCVTAPVGGFEVEGAFTAIHRPVQ